MKRDACIWKNNKIKEPTQMQLRGNLTHHETYANSTPFMSISSYRAKSQQNLSHDTFHIGQVSALDRDPAVPLWPST